MLVSFILNIRKKYKVFQLVYSKIELNLFHKKTSNILIDRRKIHSNLSNNYNKS